MKKALLIGAAIVILAIAVWSGLWFAGRGQIEDRMDLELARAEARGTKVVWGARTISGFPFGYDIDARDVAVTHAESGILVRIPQMVSRLDASAIQEVETRLIGDIRIDLPISEQNRAQDPRLPPIVTVNISGKDMRILASGMNEANRSFAVRASQADLKIDQDDLPNKVDMAINDLNATYTDSAPKRLGTLQAAQLALYADGQDTGGQEATIRVDVDALNLTGTTDLPATGNLNEVIFGGKPGTVELVYTTGRLQTLATSVDATGQGGGNFSYAGMSSTGIVGMGPGKIAFQGESRENQWTVEPKQPDSPVRGTLTSEALQASYTVPTGISDTPQPGTMRLSVIGLGGDDAFWTALDPKGQLDRTPAELVVDLEATARVTGRIDQLGPVEAFPVQISNVSVNALDLQALGGKLEAKGDVEVLQPINLPLGELKIRLSKGNAILGALTQAGLIDEPTRSMAAAMLQVYARPVDENTHETDLTFGNDGITMNGLRVQ